MSERADSSTVGPGRATRHGSATRRWPREGGSDRKDSKTRTFAIFKIKKNRKSFGFGLREASRATTRRRLSLVDPSLYVELWSGMILRGVRCSGLSSVPPLGRTERRRDRNSPLRHVQNAEESGKSTRDAVRRSICHLGRATRRGASVEPDALMRARNCRQMSTIRAPGVGTMARAGGPRARVRGESAREIGRVDRAGPV